MTYEKEEDLLNLIEVIAKEASSIGVMCHEARWDARLRRRELCSTDEDINRLLDEVLRKTVERIGAVIHLASERVDELTKTRIISGD
jgi:hypothetical protein